MAPSRSRAEVNLGNNTFIYAYGDTPAASAKVLEAYAGREQLERWKNDKRAEYSVEPYDGDRRGLDVQYVAKVRGDSNLNVRLPGVPAPIQVGKEEPANAAPPLPTRFDELTPVRDGELLRWVATPDDPSEPASRRVGATPPPATQPPNVQVQRVQNKYGGQDLTININFARFEAPGPLPRAGLREDFETTIKAVDQRVTELEKRLTERDVQIVGREVQRAEKGVESRAPSSGAPEAASEVRIDRAPTVAAEVKRDVGLVRDEIRREGEDYKATARGHLEGNSALEQYFADGARLRAARSQREAEPKEKPEWRGSITEAIAEASRRPGVTGFVNADWEKASRVRVETPREIVDNIERVRALIAPEAAQQKVYTVREDGTVYNLATQRAEFVALSAETVAQRPQLGEALAKQRATAEPQPQQRRKEEQEISIN